MEALIRSAWRVPVQPDDASSGPRTLRAPRHQSVEGRRWGRANTTPGPALQRRPTLAAAEPMAKWRRSRITPLRGGRWCAKATTLPRSPSRALPFRLELAAGRRSSCWRRDRLQGGRNAPSLATVTPSAARSRSAKQSRSTRASSSSSSRRAKRDRGACVPACSSRPPASASSSQCRIDMSTSRARSARPPPAAAGIRRTCSTCARSSPPHRHRHAVMIIEAWARLAQLHADGDWLWPGFPALLVCSDGGPLWPCAAGHPTEIASPTSAPPRQSLMIGQAAEAAPRAGARLPLRKTLSLGRRASAAPGNGDLFR